MKYERASVYFLVFLLVLPSVFWIFIDQHVWPWDQSWYGQVSVDLYYKLTNSFTDWGRTMFAAFGIKAPAIAWFGQFFVPFRGILGSVDRALMISVLLAQFLTLLFVYKIIFIFSRGDRLSSILGAIIVSSGPLFIGISHQYFVEPFQLFVVTYFLFIVVRLKDWNRYDIALACIFAFSYAMLIKITSPLYIFFSVLVIFFYWFYNSKNIKLGQYLKDKKKIFLYSIAILFLSSVGCWYVINWNSIFQFMQLASSGSAAELYGTRAVFLDKFSLWLLFFQKSFFLPIILYAIGIVLALIVFIRWKDIRFQFAVSGNRNIFYISIASILLAITFFSFQINEETRYLLPLGTYVAIIICWLLYWAKIRFLIYVVLFLFLFQFTIVHIFTLGLFDMNVSETSAWATPVQIEKKQMNTLNTIIKETCNSESVGGINVVAVEFPYLNANSLEYYAAQRRLDSHLLCYYTSLGYAENDQEKAWNRLVNVVKPPYFVTVQMDSFGKADAFNAVSLPITKRIEKSGDFTELKTIHSESVRIFKSNTKKISQ